MHSARKMHAQCMQKVLVSRFFFILFCMHFACICMHLHAFAYQDLLHDLHTKTFCMHAQALREKCMRNACKRSWLLGFSLYASERNGVNDLLYTNDAVT